MKKFIFLLILKIFCSHTAWAQKSEHIEEIIDRLSADNVINILLKSQFTFTISNYDEGVFVGKYLFDENLITTPNIAISEKNAIQTVNIDGTNFPLKYRYDQINAKIYYIKYKNKTSICIVSPSMVSGSGSQLVYFLIFSKGRNSHYQKEEFYSRFGNIKCIGDFDHNGTLDVLFINRKKDDFYTLLAADFKMRDIGIGKIDMKYLGNDRFLIIRDSLRRK